VELQNDLLQLEKHVRENYGSGGGDDVDHRSSGGMVDTNRQGGRKGAAHLILSNLDIHINVVEPVVTSEANCPRPQALGCTLDIPDDARLNHRRSESDTSDADGPSVSSALSRLPSPLERRQGSLVGQDLFLPVPTGFKDGDGGAGSGNEEGDAPSPIPSIRLTPSPTPPVTSMEATLRSQQRMSNRLCSVPEEQSAVLNQFGREKSRVEEERRRISTSGVTSSSSPANVNASEPSRGGMPAAAADTSINSSIKATSGPAKSSRGQVKDDLRRRRVVKSSEHLAKAGQGQPEAFKTTQKGKPNRRLSVGALVNMSVLKMTEFKRSSEAFKSSGVVSGPAHAFNPHQHPQRTRNKSIPIINPIVKAPNWPAYKKASSDALSAPTGPIMDWTPPQDKMKERSVMNNYFGIGIDAKISLDFHNKREAAAAENTVKSRSRAKNYMLYGMLGSKELLQKTFKNLEKRVVLECDGEAIPLPSLQGIVVLNISSFMGGTNFWGNTKDDEFLPPSFDDGILEVVAVFGSMHMGASRLMNLQRHRIAQCRSIVIRVLGSEGVPVQVDGEAWLHPPGIIRIVHKNRFQLVCRDKATENQLKSGGSFPRALLREHANVILLPLDNDESELLRSLINASKQFQHFLVLIHHALDGPEAMNLAAFAHSIQESLHSLTLDGVSNLSTSEVRTRSATLAKHLRVAIDSCKRILVENFQDAQCETAGKLSQSIYVVESLLGKCHEENDLLFFTIRPDMDGGVPNQAGLGGIGSSLGVSTGPSGGVAGSGGGSGGAGSGGGSRRNSWFKVPKFIGSSSSGTSGGGGSVGGHESSSSCLVEIVMQWSPHAVSQWLEAVGLPMYCHAFLDHEISGKELLALEKSDFKDVGVTKVGHIKRLQHGVRDLHHGRLPRRLLHSTCGTPAFVSSSSSSSEEIGEPRTSTSSEPSPAITGASGQLPDLRNKKSSQGCRLSWSPSAAAIGGKEGGGSSRGALRSGRSFSPHLKSEAGIVDLQQPPTSVSQTRSRSTSPSYCFSS